ncbi:hypothetical protein C8Q76DRAFT_9408 [Earliella scabrosa]|nr:hypothetical protein C8Q76DRAFT_9408 [Earliella scabrosa]
MAHGDMSFFPASPKPSKKDTPQRQCRNVLIYGSCKFQDKGCIYYHPPLDEPSFASPDSPTLSAALPAQAVNAPVFVPKGHPGSPSLSDAVPASIQQQASVSSYVPQCSQPHILPKQASPSPSRPSCAVWALCAHRMLNRLSVTPPPPTLLLPSYRSNRTNRSSILTQNSTILTTPTPMQSIMVMPPKRACRCLRLTLMTCRRTK